MGEPWYENVEKGWKDSVNEQERVLQNGLDTAIASEGVGLHVSVVVGAVGLGVVLLL